MPSGSHFRPRHKSNVTGTCKMSCSSPPAMVITEWRAWPFGIARHVYHNRAINFIRLVPVGYNILWSLHFRQLQTVESECLCILDEALSMHIIICRFPPTPILLTAFRLKEQTFYFVILIDGHKPDILAQPGSLLPRVCSHSTVALIKERVGGKFGKTMPGYSRRKEQVFRQSRRHAHTLQKILCFL